MDIKQHNRLVEQLTAWIQQEDLFSSEAYLSAHAADLVTNAGLRVMRLLVEANPDNPDVREHLDLLQRAVVVGIQQMYEEWRRQILRESEEMRRKLVLILKKLLHPNTLDDFGKRITLCRQAIHLIESLPGAGILESDAFQWAILQLDLADSLIQTTEGDHAENIEQALHHYQEALRVFGKDIYPESWANTHHLLGNAYRLRLRGEPADNIEQAIRHYEQALEVRTATSDLVEWAQTHRNLADCYRLRVRGERAQNLERAIEGYGYALQGFTREEFPDEWATCQSNLGLAYSERLNGNPG